jgi:hypothetical protein
MLPLLLPTQLSECSMINQILLQAEVILPILIISMEVMDLSDGHMELETLMVFLLEVLISLPSPVHSQ